LADLSAQTTKAAQIRAALTTETPAAAALEVRAGRYRWRICAFLFFATTINYIDRQVLGVLAPELQKVIGWNELQYGYIVAAFQAAYALGLVAIGSFIDRVGTRIGYAVAIALWSLSAMSHALVQSVLAFGFVRFLLGLGESGNFPAAIKTVAEWFPRKERSLATGVFNSGSNIGAIAAPLAAPWIAVHWGWRWAFLLTGFFSAAWLLAWLSVYREPRRHAKLSPAELAYIESDVAEPIRKIPWAQLLPYRQTWAYLVGKLLTDPVWWFFLSWLPKFLNARHGLSLIALGPPLVAIYVMADVGSIAGGWLPGLLLRLGWSVNRARKTAMLACALAVTPIVFAASVSNVWAAVGLIGLAAASHQGWSANLFTLASDMFPRRAVASVVGVGGFGGAVGGMCISAFTGFLLQFTGTYVPVFIMAGSAYLVALLFIQILAPRLDPARVDESII
jgi:MFS transporter, ACS family, hexuronate transporter